MHCFQPSFLLSFALSLCDCVLVCGESSSQLRVPLLTLSLFHPPPLKPFSLPFVLRTLPSSFSSSPLSANENVSSFSFLATVL